MSQPDILWTNATIDPSLPSPEQDIYTEAQIEEAFAQHAAGEPLLSSTYDDSLQAPSFTYDCGSIPNADSSEPSAVSTPDSSCYDFGQHSPAYALSGASTPYPYAFEKQQAHQVDSQDAAERRPLPFRTPTNSSFVLPSEPLPGHAHRRSVSHGDVDRNVTAPAHPTFVRLQGFQSSRHISAKSEDDRRSGQIKRSGRSSSQGPSVLGRPLKEAVPYPMIGTHIGSSLHEPKDKKSRKSKKRSKHSDKRDDDGNTSPKFADPIIRNMTNPAQLAQSRRIIEIGAVAVRNHSKLDPRLKDVDGLSPHARIMKKLEDVERYLQRDEAQNAEALKGCAMIREALKQRARSIDASVDMEGDEKIADRDALEAPSKIMAEDDLGLFGACLGDDDLMSLLMRENEHMDAGE
ncbi:hypothetical protein DE146DRAFT_295733 [Phaeosphaeria sp. MPI-PUGE-AT-0046c]|nr:hypothetical protein DE146DRAFT_295733 [Phaeosphaeria sp. MPI-PUGE-AT-0046c]